MYNKMAELTEEMFSDKWMKQFNKLCVEDRKKVLEVIVGNTMSDALMKVSTEQMIAGMRFQGESLYKKYVQKMDECSVGSAEWSELAEKLLSELRMLHLKYVQMYGKNGEVDSDEN